MKTAKFTLSVCIIILLVMFANGLYILSKPGFGVRRQPEIINSDSGEKEQSWEYKHSESSTGKQSIINVLVLGLDKDETRSDVILLINYNPEQPGLNILSIARDTRILRSGKYTKINTLYGKGGEKLIAEKVTEITGLPVHYYITMNFKGFRKIIDTLGGVRFYVPFNMYYDDPTQNLHIHLKKGMQLLDGSKAEKLIRYRKGNKSGVGYNDGDIGRIKMQQEFLKELIKQKANIKYLSRADEVFGILKEYVKTNITLADITGNISGILKIDSAEIGTYTLPGESRYINEVWYYIYNPSKTKELIESSFYR